MIFRTIFFKPRGRLAAILIVFLLVGLTLRKGTCTWVLGQMVRKHLAPRGIQLSYTKLSISGLKTIKFEELSLTRHADTLIASSSMVINPSAKTLFTGKVHLREFSLTNTRIYLPLDTFLLTDSMPYQQHSPSDDTRDIPGFLSRLLRHTRPDRIRFAEFRDVRFVLAYKSETTHIAIDTLTKSRHQFYALLTTGADKGQKNTFRANGRIGHRDFEVSVHNEGARIIDFPLLTSLTATSFGFDSLYGQLGLSSAGEGAKVLAAGGIFNSRWFNKRISAEEVVLDSLAFRFGLRLAPALVEVDSASRFSINGIAFCPYIRYSSEKTDSLIVKFLPTEWDAEQFFSRLPAGLFDDVRRVEAQGKMRFHMSFATDLHQPEGLHFDMQLRGEGLKFTNGLGNFARIRETFTHRVYDRGQFVKEITVGPENPSFVPLGQISPFLKYAVLTSEDGGFYHHAGFNTDAFAGAIAQNIRERRFARGGSTISMQLVKNLFLNRNKNVFRKVEEALIVWIMERNHLVSKDRMLEVYFNIIEWGPGIYGIGPASQFYFSKAPSQLSLSESVYLASIVPRPKAFKYSFEGNGQLKPFFEGYYRLVTGIMVHRQQLTSADTAGGFQPVWLQGASEAWLTSPDTTVVDTLAVEDYEPFGVVDTLGWK